MDWHHKEQDSRGAFFRHEVFVDQPVLLDERGEDVLAREGHLVKWVVAVVLDLVFHEQLVFDVGIRIGLVQSHGVFQNKEVQIQLASQKLAKDFGSALTGSHRTIISITHDLELAVEELNLLPSYFPTRPCILIVIINNLLGNVLIRIQEVKLKDAHPVLSPLFLVDVVVLELAQIDVYSITQRVIRFDVLTYYTFLRPHLLLILSLNLFFHGLLLVCDTNIQGETICADVIADRNFLGGFQVDHIQMRDVLVLMLFEHHVFAVFDFAEVVLLDYGEGGCFHEHLHLSLIFEIEVYLALITFIPICFDKRFLQSLLLVVQTEGLVRILEEPPKRHQNIVLQVHVLDEAKIGLYGRLVLLLFPIQLRFVEELAIFGPLWTFVLLLHQHLVFLVENIVDLFVVLK